MNDGFTESETLGLFAKVLEMDVNELPIEARKIHEECKGMPLLIAMFAAQFEEFKDDMKIQPDRWKYYLDCLRKRDATNRYEHHVTFKVYIVVYKVYYENHIITHIILIFIFYRVMREFFQKQETIFDMSIEQLKPDLRGYYATMAVFNEDVNITPKVHKILYIFVIIKFNTNYFVISCNPISLSLFQVLHNSIFYRLWKFSGDKTYFMSKI
jgi:hypothetical protein